MFVERHSLKLLRLAALDFYSLQDVQFSLAISEIVSLLYIANYFSVRVAMVLIKSKIKQCPIRSIITIWSNYKTESDITVEVNTDLPDPGLAGRDT